MKKMIGLATMVCGLVLFTFCPASFAGVTDEIWRGVLGPAEPAESEVGPLGGLVDMQAQMLPYLEGKWTGLIDLSIFGADFSVATYRKNVSAVVGDTNKEVQEFMYCTPDGCFVYVYVWYWLDVGFYSGQKQIVSGRFYYSEYDDGVVFLDITITRDGKAFLGDRYGYCRVFYSPNLLRGKCDADGWDAPPCTEGECGGGILKFVDGDIILRR